MILCKGHRKDGTPCRRPPSRGKNVCNSHGAKSKAGAESPAFKHGRYSSALPDRLLERYRNAVEDPELLDLTQQIAVMDARLHELLGRVDSGESGAIWKAMKAAYKDWQAEKRKKNGDPQAAEAHLVAMIEKGFADNAAWIDVFEVFELRRVAVQTDSRRRKELQDSISSQQALTLMAAMVEAVRRHVSDTNTLQAISIEFTGLMRRDGSQGAITGS